MYETSEPTQYQCRHIKPDGRRCGSPSLRGEHFCFYHHAARRSGPRQPQGTTTTARRASTFELPSPADLSEPSGIGMAVGLILHKIAHNEIDPRRAGLLLYGLQIASLNLKRSPGEKPRDVPCIEDIALDPDHGLLAPEAELAQSAGEGFEGRGKVQRIVEKIDRERAAERQREEAVWAERRRFLEEERAQREQWAREDALRAGSDQARTASLPTLQAHATLETSTLLPEQDQEVPGPADQRGNQLSIGTAPTPNRATRRHLHRLLRRGTTKPHPGLGAPCRSTSNQPICNTLPRK